MISPGPRAATALPKIVAGVLLWSATTLAVDRLRARVAAEPELQDDPMVKALLAGDLAPLLAGDRHEGLLHVVGLTHAGLTVDEFQAAVAAWMETARHPRFKRRYDHLTYQPMQELLAFLRAHGFKTWIVSGVAPMSCGSGRSGSTASRPSR